jgi:hypothetical protein
MNFSALPPDEIERRRRQSITAYRARQDEAFAHLYQERCDTFYWSRGRCCAGCDFWTSSEGDIGECTSAPPVSGDQVLKSLGISWSSYTPPPGQPFTRRDHVCGAFQDNFDWSMLDGGYLKRIGARL